MEPADLQLTVWFDNDCGLCTRVASWLSNQPKFVPVHCVPAQSAEQQRCPISTKALLDKVTVTASDGAVYRGSNAWIIVLWALRNYRHWSLRFAERRWRWLAENLFAVVTGLAKMSKRK